MEITRVGDIPLRIIPPRERERSQGAILLFHGLRMGGESLEREAWWLSSAGFTTFLVDAPHHGARHSEVLGTMPDALTLEGHRVLLRILREARAEIPTLFEHVRSLGHEKIAIAGVSMGAFVALSGASVEPRLAAVVSILGSPDWSPREGEVPEDLIEAVAESPHHRPEAFAMPLLLLNGNRDENVRPGPARALAERVPHAIHREYHSEHWVNEHDWADMWMAAVGFLARALATTTAS